MKRADCWPFATLVINGITFVISPCNEDYILDFDKFITLDCTQCGWRVYDKEDCNTGDIGYDATGHETVCKNRLEVSGVEPGK